MGQDDRAHTASAPRPNLFIVGPPRSGTTALYYYLDRHPQVYMSPVKELHYFCPDLFLPSPQIALRDEAAYLTMFSSAVGERRVGEASPFYIYSACAPQAISAFATDPRIIITLRNPADMMYSMYCLRRHAAIFHPGQEPLDSFAAALAEEPARLRGERVPSGVPPQPGQCLHLCYRELARYPDRVERWIRVFGREAVHVLIFDDWVANPGASYRTLCRFLDVDPEVTPTFDLPPERRAASARPRSATLARLLWRPSPRLAAAARRALPARARRGFRALLQDWNNALPPKLDPGLRKRLLEDSTSDVRRLEDILGRDLAAWRP